MNALLRRIIKDLGKRKGFTFVEVLVVLTIIGLLSSIIFVGLGGFRARGRDTRRLADLKSIQGGLELFYSKNHVYPQALGDLLTANIGVTKLPVDPSNNAAYFYSYKTADQQGYVLSAHLDAVDATDKIYSDRDTVSNLGEYSGTATDCGGQFYCIAL